MSLSGAQGSSVKRLPDNTLDNLYARLKELETWKRTFYSSGFKGLQPRKVTSTITGNASDANFLVTHNLHSRAIAVSVHAVASPYSSAALNGIDFTDPDHVTIKFSSAPGSGEQFEVTMIG